MVDSVFQGTNFIRCIKPNSKMIDRQFEGSLALAQLKCSGTISVLELMEHGYPSRVLFADLYSMYKSVLPPELVSLPARTFCEAMFQSLNLSAKDFKFGITKVFFRPGKFVEFDRIMRSDPENMLAIVAKVKKWLIRSRWVKSALGALCVIKRKLSYKVFYIISSGMIFISISLVRNRIIYRNKCVLIAQRIARGFLARKQHRPRYQGIGKINKIRTNTLKTIEIASGLKMGRDEIVSGVNDIYRQIDDAIKKIKVGIGKFLLWYHTDFELSLCTVESSHHPTGNGLDVHRGHGQSAMRSCKSSLTIIS